MTIAMENGLLHVTNPANDTIWATNAPLNYTLDALGESTEDNSTHFYQSIVQEPCPGATDLRNNPDYILYYITIANMIFMGICPMSMMIVFNILVSKTLIWFPIIL